MGLNLRHKLRSWFLSSALTFILYEVFWGVAPVGDAEPLKTTHWLIMLGFDFCYCMLFTLTSMIISQALRSIGYFNRLTRGSQLAFCLLTLVVNMSLAFCFEKIYNLLWPAPSQEMFWSSVYMFCFIATLLSLVHTTSHYCMMAIRQKDQLVSLQKKALKRQLDPHFVFNSLSALAELTRQNPMQAEAYVIRLSHVYRYILSHIEQEYATVEESLRFIRDYVALQELRLDGRIDLVIRDCDSRPGDRLLPMSLQLLVENAVKYNPPSAGETLCIDISREGDEIIVRNPIVTSRPNIPGFGLGLESMKEYYVMEGLQPPVVSVNQGWFEVRMKVINL